MMKATDIGDIELFLNKVILLTGCKKDSKKYPLSKECLHDGYVMEIIDIDNALKYKRNIECDDIDKLRKYIEETYEVSTGDIVIVNDSNICLACKKDCCGSLYFYYTNYNGSKNFNISIQYSGNKIMYTCRDKFNEKLYLVEIGSNLSKEEKIKMKIIEDKSECIESEKKETVDPLDIFKFSIEVRDDDGHELNFKSKEESFTAVTECLDYINNFEKIIYVHLSGNSDLVVYAVNRLLEAFKIKLIFSKTYSDKDKTIMCLEAKE